MKSTIISEAMVRDHGKLVKLLIDFEKSIVQDKKTMMEAFNEFAWELEKHFFTEEKAIFISYEPKDETEGYGDQIEEILEGEKDPWFTRQFIGKSLSDNIALSEDDGVIDAISGATISSKAITDSVSEGLKELMEIVVK